MLVYSGEDPKTFCAPIYIVTCARRLESSRPPGDGFLLRDPDAPDSLYRLDIFAGRCNENYILTKRKTELANIQKMKEEERFAHTKRTRATRATRFQRFE